MGAGTVKTDLSVSYIDHNMAGFGPENHNDHLYLQTGAARSGVYHSRAGNGICHQVHLERFGKPGATLLGSDSHTPTGGGIGMLAIGAGGMDVAVAMAGGPFYLKCPKVLGVKLTGELTTKIKGWASYHHENNENTNESWSDTWDQTMVYGVKKLNHTVSTQWQFNLSDVTIFSAKYLGFWTDDRPNIPGDSPDHPGYPTTWLIRNTYAGILNPSWPGVESATIALGEPVTLKYRIYIHRGNVQKGRVLEAYRLYLSGQ